MSMEIKNEVGKIYGPWIVTEVLSYRYNKNGCAQFNVRCQGCGRSKLYTGNDLRFNKYAHSCRRCKKR